MKTTLISQGQRWSCLLYLLAAGWAHAQFVEVAAEVEVVHWGPTFAGSHRWSVQCVVGTNSWQMDGDFLRNGKTTNWFTGTNIVVHSVVTENLDIDLGAQPLILRGSPIGSQFTRAFESVDGNPGKPARHADALPLLGNIAWLAFCSGPSLNREGRQLFPPSDLWKELIAAPASGFVEKTLRFEDSFGLPKSVNLSTTNGQPVFQYRVTRSTNVLGWEFPLEFSLAQYRPTYLQESNSFAGPGWDLDLIAKGKVIAIGPANKPPRIPPAVQAAAGN